MTGRARDRPRPVTGIVIDRVRDGDLAKIMRDFERFWGDRELPRALHHPMFFCEFADTALAARRGTGDTSEIAGYLLGFVAPTGDGYITTLPPNPNRTNLWNPRPHSETQP